MNLNTSLQEKIIFQYIHLKEDLLPMPSGEKSSALAYCVTFVFINFRLVDCKFIYSDCYKIFQVLCYLRQC